MKKAKFQWTLPEPVTMDETFQAALAEQKIPSLLGEIIWKRGIQSTEALQQFLQPDLARLHDPFLLFEMEKAVERLRAAIEKGEHILIYGDYDADGITSTTVIKEALDLLGANVSYYLPNRFTDGYGPNVDVYRTQISEHGVQLILTVDNGVSGHEAIAYANSQGIDVIVTDHHELPEVLPDAYAIIHPRHPQGNYPFGELAGVGVAFKLACALLEEVPTEFLDLVAIGTVADMVSLTDENRVMVQIGLELMKQTERIGLLALLNACKVRPQDIVDTTIGFSLAPRLNALGRLDDPNPAVTLLTTFDDEEAQMLAKQLNDINEQRKALVETTVAAALRQVDEQNDIHLLVGNDWHEGILGIVAGKVLQQTGKPAIVLTKKADGTAKGSGRSPETLNLYNMLVSMNDLFVNFGGHHAAIGLTIEQTKIATLQVAMNAYIQEQQIDLTQGLPLAIDAVLSLDDVTTTFIEQLQIFSPCGMDNPLPKFAFENIQTMNQRVIGTNQQHLKLVIQQAEQTQQLDTIAFNFGAQVQEFSQDQLSLVGQLTINEWNGRKKPQLMLEDYQVEGMQVFDVRSKKYLQQLTLTTPTLAIHFAEKVPQQLAKAPQTTYVHFEDLPTLQHFVGQQQFEQVIFLDCPLDQQVIREIVQTLAISRVYLACLALDEAYLDGVGNREQYAKLFKLVAAQKQLDVRHKIGQMANYLQMPQNLLIFMIQVFFELGFVTINDGVLRSVEKPANRLLTESQLYQDRLQKIKSQEFLLLSDLPEIKKWLINQEEQK